MLLKLLNFDPKLCGVFCVFAVSRYSGFISQYQDVSFDTDAVMNFETFYLTRF